jgi:CheY-like chemotaxis protein
MTTTRRETLRLLVADDNDDMRLLVRATLAIDGRLCVVAEAEDGLTALHAFREEQPDACVLDYRMPGLTGLEVARQILVERPETLVLIFAAYVPADVLHEAAALGIHHLRKDLFSDLTGTLLEMAAQ